MRPATDEQRQKWLTQAEYTAPAREYLTALVQRDLALAEKLWPAEEEVDMLSRLALVWPILFSFLEQRRALNGFWDDFCSWRAEMQTAAELDENFGYLDDDDLASLVDDSDEEEDY